jgi:hypothetical protein
MVNLLGGPHFDDLARIHDVHPIGIAGDHAEVVGDDDQGHAKAPGQVFHQLQDLRLDGHVQRRGGFVGDDQLGLAAQGQGDHDPLAHADGNLGATHLADLLVAQLQQIAASEVDDAIDDFAGRVGDQAQNGHGAHRLAAARLADDGDGLAFVDIIGNAVDRLHDPGGGSELGTKILNVEQLGHGGALLL